MKKTLLVDWIESTVRRLKSVLIVATGVMVAHANSGEIAAFVALFIAGLVAWSDVLMRVDYD